ncbi:AraC-like DNA-binding protein [Flavobacterium sp. HSC-32F16]|uniref:helix-turn-helix domain-containing protein n=1 Tax=Flavobacterium sp. HSC-32F16 TaxID=2910964 RepID=UPI0020A2E60F|nr:helix-turn-helix transcriptional regulator [Flavobacterium sp. HSC-32F16]MCP2028507.1 AraC-like DNA-binding protein [Flavobacterium sp. HSC-32F16]
MEKTQSIEDFYKTKFNWIPENIRKEIGHFNIFRLDDFAGKHARPMPYGRKDYYNISLIIGPCNVYYGDKVVEIKKKALLFANPHIPYNWLPVNGKPSGFLCVFTVSFFHQYGKLQEYEVFMPDVVPVFELSDEQEQIYRNIFLKMTEEIGSTYIHKYDALRNYIFEIVHHATKNQTVTAAAREDANAAKRISVRFLELLERQFPIEDARQRLILRSPSDFAEKLSVHVNHLNKAIKEITQKTTSEIIIERILQEAKILLKQTNWNVSEIAYALGFAEVTNFNNFFKKHINLSPVKFRNI